MTSRHGPSFNGDCISRECSRVSRCWRVSPPPAASDSARAASLGETSPSGPFPVLNEAYVTACQRSSDQTPRPSVTARQRSSDQTPRQSVTTRQRSSDQTPRPSVTARQRSSDQTPRPSVTARQRSSDQSPRPSVTARQRSSDQTLWSGILS